MAVGQVDICVRDQQAILERLTFFTEGSLPHHVFAQPHRGLMVALLYKEIQNVPSVNVLVRLRGLRYLFSLAEGFPTIPHRHTRVVASWSLIYVEGLLVSVGGSVFCQLLQDPIEVWGAGQQEPRNRGVRSRRSFHRRSLLLGVNEVDSPSVTVCVSPVRSAHDLHMLHTLAHTHFF